MEGEPGTQSPQRQQHEQPSQDEEALANIEEEAEDDEEEYENDEDGNAPNIGTYLEPPQPETEELKKMKKKPYQSARLGCLEKVLEEREVEARTELYKGANELVDYMKANWKLNLPRTKSAEAMEYRMDDKAFHKRPKSYWIQNRKRQKEAERTGFVSDITKTYQTIGQPELDVPLFFLRNVPEYVKIDTAAWITSQIEKAVEKHQNEAPLPHMPYRRYARPSITRGKINHGPGGSDLLDALVKEAEGFQKGIKGSQTLTKLLTAWQEHREDLRANKGSAFGMVKRGAKARTQRADSDVQQFEKYKDMKPNLKYEKRTTVVDEKTFQLEMAILERMLLSIIILVKSILNVSSQQLKSEHRIPFAGITHLRSVSPEVIQRKRTRFIPSCVLEKYKRDPSMYNLMKKIHSENIADGKDPGKSENYKKNVLPIVNASKAKVRLPRVTVPKDTSIPANRAVPDMIPVDEGPIADIYPLEKGLNREKHLVAARRIKEIIESQTYLEDPIAPIIPPTVEQTIEIAKRMEKDKRRFETIFDKSYKQPIPIWHDVEILKEMLETKHSLERSVPEFTKKKRRISSLVSEATAKIREKPEYPETPKIPKSDDIPTPVIPGMEEEEQLDSLEQSRLNLLTKIPDADSHLYNDLLYQKLFKLAGVKSTDRQNFATVMAMKTEFHNTERKLKLEYEVKAEKHQLGTFKRFESKVSAISDNPVFARSIYAMRHAAHYLQIQERRKALDAKLKLGKVPSKWYRDLIDKCESLQAFRHNGCTAAISKLYNYCDMDSNSRPHVKACENNKVENDLIHKVFLLPFQMLGRFTLVVVSLPLSELATARFQHAIRFLLDHLFEAPEDLMKQWLKFRGVPYLLV